MSSCVSLNSSEIYDNNIQFGGCYFENIPNWLYWLIVILIVLVGGMYIYKYFYPTPQTIRQENTPIIVQENI
jgi:hypothetical protein